MLWKLVRTPDDRVGRTTCYDTRGRVLVWFGDKNDVWMDADDLRPGDGLVERVGDYAGGPRQLGLFAR